MKFPLLFSAILCIVFIGASSFCFQDIPNFNNLKAIDAHGDTICFKSLGGNRFVLQQNGHKNLFISRSIGELLVLKDGEYTFKEEKHFSVSACKSFKWRQKYLCLAGIDSSLRKQLKEPYIKVFFANGKTSKIQLQDTTQVLPYFSQNDTQIKVQFYIKNETYIDTLNMRINYWHTGICLHSYPLPKPSLIRVTADSVILNYNDDHTVKAKIVI